MLCKTEKMLEEEIHTANIAKSEGLDAAEISLSEIKKLEPNVRMNIQGGTYYKCDSHGTPGEFMEELKSALLSKGVTIKSNEKATDFNVESGKIRSVVTSKETITCDEVVLAAGSWSSFISRKLGIKILLQAGKGYRINSERPHGVTLPAILAEAKVAVTPMHGFTRFAGTMEIAGINSDINPIRVESIANAVNRYYPEIEVTEEEKSQATSGLRPVSPDGLPYIGKSFKCSNLTIATGHAMMGWTMAPATGKMVSEIVSDKKTSIPLEGLHPDRRF